MELARDPESRKAEMKVIAHSLPIDDRDGLIFRSTGTLNTHILAFQLCLEQLEAFYEQMNTIDEFCFVVHPLVVSTKCRQRTFKIGKLNLWYLLRYYKTKHIFHWNLLHIC